MFIKQLTIFVENKSGRVADILNALGNAHIDIRALSIADTSDYGLMRMIVSDPEKARDTLIDIGVVVRITEVIAVPIDNCPGGLAYVTEQLRGASIAIEYLYAFVGRKDSGAIVVMKTDKPEETLSVLEAKGIRTLADGNTL